MKRVFVSYRHVKPDEDLAKVVARQLRDRGHAVFIDLDIRPGQDWTKAIGDALSSSDWLVVFLSKDSITSDMVRHEVQLAHSHGMHILPIRIGVVPELPYDLGAWLGRFQYSSWKPDMAGDELASLVSDAIAQSGGAQATQSPEAHAHQDRVADQSGPAHLSTDCADGRGPLFAWEPLRTLLTSEMALVNQECVRLTSRPLDSIFVPRRFVRWNGSGGQPGRDDGLGRGELPSTWSQVMDLSCGRGGVVVLAEAGLGKTILALREVHELCRTALEQAQDAPSCDVRMAFYLHSRQLTSIHQGSAPDPPGAVADLIVRRHMLSPSPPLRAAICQGLCEGRVCLVLDAIDETSGAEELQVKQLINLMLRPPWDFSMLITCRPSAYAPLSNVVEWELLPFSGSELKKGTSRWLHAEPKSGHAFMKMIARVPPLAELLASPLLSRLAWQVWGRNPEAAPFDGGARQVSRGALYNEFLLYLMERGAERAQGRQEPLPPLQRSSLVRLACRLAWELWNRDPGRTAFAAGDLGEAIEQSGPPAALRDRTDLLRDLTDSGLLVSTGTAGGEPQYQFLHRTLFEYLCAGELARRLRNHEAEMREIVSRLVADAQTSTILWMTAGRVDTAECIVCEILRLVNQQMSSSQPPSLSGRPLHLRGLLIDCLVECPATLRAQTRREAWEVVANELDAAQRRARSTEWKALAGFGVVYRALRAVERHEGPAVKAQAVLDLVEELRAHNWKLQPSGKVEATLTEALQSPSPVVRWAAVWISTAVEQPPIIVRRLSALLATDQSPNVRCLAYRARARSRDEAAFAALSEGINDASELAAAGAIIGLGRLQKRAAEEILIRLAEQRLHTANAIAHDRCLITVVHALEEVVSDQTATWIGGKGGQSKVAHWGARLSAIFLRVLDTPAVWAHLPAMSGLGKMGCTAARPRLEKILLQAPDAGMRASAAYALDQLARVIEPESFAESATVLLACLGDEDQPARLRRSVVSALEILVRRGHRSPDLVPLLVRYAQHRDLVIARTSILALTRFAPDETLTSLEKLAVDAHPAWQKEVCEAVQNQPTRTGLWLLCKMLEGSAPPPIELHALTAFKAAGEKFRDWRLWGRPDYADDEALLGAVISCGVRLAKDGSREEVLCSALMALEEIALLPKVLESPSGELFGMVQQSVRAASVSPVAAVRQTAFFALGRVGSSQDARRLEALLTEATTEEARWIRGAIRAIEQRLRGNAERRGPPPGGRSR